MPEPSPELRIWAIRDGEWAQYVSDAYAVGGDVERALEWLELARTGGFFNHEYLADHDPFVNELRGLEEWKAAIDQVRKSHAEFEARLNPL